MENTTEKRNVIITALLTALFALGKKFDKPLARLFDNLKVSRPSLHLALAIMFVAINAVIGFLLMSGLADGIDALDIALGVSEIVIQLLGYSAGTRTTRYIQESKEVEPHQNQF